MRSALWIVLFLTLQSETDPSVFRLSHHAPLAPSTFRVTAACTGLAAAHGTTNPTTAALPTVCSGSPPAPRKLRQPARSRAEAAHRAARTLGLPALCCREEGLHRRPTHGKAAVARTAGWCLTATATRPRRHTALGRRQALDTHRNTFLPAGTVQGEHGTQDPHVACRHLQGLALRQPAARYALTSPRRSPATERLLVVHFLLIFILVGTGICGHPVSSTLCSGTCKIMSQLQDFLA